MTVKKGDKIKVEYTGTLDNGEVFDSSETHGQPLEFVAGEGQVVKGFDDAVIGMDKNQEKEIKIPPKDGYGDINEQLIQKVPKDKLPKEAEAGMVLGVTLPNGQQIPAKIAEMNDESATVDLNHPMAGKTMNFKIKIVGVNCEDCGDGCGCK